LLWGAAVPIAHLATEVNVNQQLVFPGLLALMLTACGGGGGGGRDDFYGSSYLVSGFNRFGQEVRVCIDGIDPPDPNSARGRDTTDSLLEYYGLGGPVQVALSFELSCVELDPTVDEVVTVEEYNAVIVPSTGKKPPPAILREPRPKVTAAST
jgi:hypothetical protein